MSLRQKIEEEIRQHGPIPFSRYMGLCLYDPEFGYYSRRAEQFGRAGDFYTSSDVHAVFGRLLARQFEEMWRTLDSPETIELVELGPGRGLFAQDVLDWSEKKFPDFFRALHYTLAEGSPALREKLKKTLSRHFDSRKVSFAGSKHAHASAASTAKRYVGPTTFPGQRVFASQVPIIVFANEFFDALPVEVISSQGELRIDMLDGRFVESWVPASPDGLCYLDCFSLHPGPGERVEAPILAQEYMRRIAESVGPGFVVVVDYGYTRDEQLAGRHRGTVMAYRRHSASADAYEAPGEQDITAHVNFTSLAGVAQQRGLRVEKLLTQSQFLLGIGETNQFADAFEECHLPQERAKVALQLKHLVTPAGMGETFHVMIASHGVDAAKVAQLSGLRFLRSRL